MSTPVKRVDSLLAPGERLLCRTRRHWVALLPGVGGALALAAAGAAASTLGRLGSWESLAAAAVGAGLLVLALPLALLACLRWGTEAYLVTTRRVVHTVGLRRRALDAPLAAVAEVGLTQGLPGRLLGYGTLEIRLAGEGGIHRLECLPRPLAVEGALRAAMAGLLAAEAARIAEAAAGERPPAYRSPAERLTSQDEVRRSGLLATSQVTGSG